MKTDNTNDDNISNNEKQQVYR